MHNNSQQLTDYTYKLLKDMKARRVGEKRMAATQQTPAAQPRVVEAQHQ
jgi:hypothetical protein